MKLKMLRASFAVTLIPSHLIAPLSMSSGRKFRPVPSQLSHNFPFPSLQQLGHCNLTPTVTTASGCLKLPTFQPLPVDHFHAIICRLSASPPDIPVSTVTHPDPEPTSLASSHQVSIVIHRNRWNIIFLGVSTFDFILQLHVKLFNILS